jgi:hypothetical protein
MRVWYVGVDGKVKRLKALESGINMNQKRIELASFSSSTPLMCWCVAQVMAKRAIIRGNALLVQEEN